MEYIIDIYNLLPEEITDYYMINYVNPHIIRELGLEKWGITITPFF